MEAADKLMAARCRLMMKEPFYGHLAMGMTWHANNFTFEPNEEARTMGVRIVNGGEIQCIYYPPFVERLKLEEIYAVVQHELEHILRCHCIRVGDRDPRAWNIAADMTVNGTRSNPRIGYKDGTGDSGVIIPMKNEIVWIPEDWDKEGSSEEYYAKLMKDQKNVCPKCGKAKGAGGGGKKGKGQQGQGQGNQQGQGQGQGQGNQPGQGQGGQGQPGQGQGGQGGGGCCDQCGGDDDGGSTYSYGSVQGKPIDNHSVWQQTDVAEDEARQLIHDLVQQTIEKSQGHVPGHMQEILKHLSKPVVRWRELLRQYLGRHVGNARRTYSRANRRFTAFGMPGVSHHAAANVNVIVDTSGSVSTKELEQFFAEIDTIAYRSKIMVLLWDHSFQGFSTYRKGDWKKFKINGRGGTDMAAPMRWLMEQKKIADVQVMFTDGECNYIEKQDYPMITVISRGKGYGQEPGWGHCVYMSAPKESKSK